MQIIDTILHGEGVRSYYLLTYPYYLLTQMGPWFILGLVGIVQLIKNKNQMLFHYRKLFLILFTLVIFLFSFVRWKILQLHCHFLPRIGRFSGLSIKQLLMSKQHYIRPFFNLYRYFILLVATILLIFPIGQQSRDPLLFEVLDWIKYNNPQITRDWYIVDESYAYFSWPTC